MATPQDPIGVALGSIGTGATGGAAVITLGIVVLRTLQSPDPTALTQDDQFLIISVGLAAGITTAVTTSLALSRTIPTLWRRGVTAGVSVFAATILATVAAPIDLTSGGVGLIIYVALLLGAANYSRKKAQAAARR